jgi:hypothetical protein
MEVEDAVPETREEDQIMAESEPGGYTAQLATILALREQDSKSQELRTAREAMAAQFPLGPDIWDAWIDDEIETADDAVQRRYVLDLCSCSVQDYLCGLQFTISFRRWA